MSREDAIGLVALIIFAIDKSGGLAIEIEDLRTRQVN